MMFKWFVFRWLIFTDTMNGKLMTVNNTETPIELIKTGKDTYSVREWDFKLKMVKNEQTGNKELAQILPNDKIRSQGPKMADSEKTPLEMILEGNFDQGLEVYKNAKIKDQTHHLLSESYLNDVGYTMLRKKEFTKAIDVFRLNAALYPESENVYDSLGEAYLNAGQKDKARENYQKVLEINPKNQNVGKVLKTL